MLASWIVQEKSADTRVSGSREAGDTIDFVVDCGRGGDYSFDRFDVEGDDHKEPAKAPRRGDDRQHVGFRREFSGLPREPSRLIAWEKYAQVLLESNEFAFVIESVFVHESHESSRMKFKMPLSYS
jgi:hypothetical protein